MKWYSIEIHIEILPIFSSPSDQKWSSYIHAKGFRELSIFYTGLYPEYRNKIKASVRRSIVNIPLDNNLDLFEKIVENQTMWLRERQLIKKIASIPNINVVTSLVV